MVKRALAITARKEGVMYKELGFGEMLKGVSTDNVAAIFWAYTTKSIAQEG
jgi:hypothetical protein